MGERKDREMEWKRVGERVGGRKEVEETVRGRRVRGKPGREKKGHAESRGGRKGRGRVVSRPRDGDPLVPLV